MFPSCAFKVQITHGAVQIPILKLSPTAAQELMTAAIETDAPDAVSQAATVSGNVVREGIWYKRHGGSGHRLFHGSDTGCTALRDLGHRPKALSSGPKCEVITLDIPLWCASGNFVR